MHKIIVATLLAIGLALACGEMSRAELVIVKNGRITGTIYTIDRADLRAFHAGQGEDAYWVTGWMHPDVDMSDPSNWPVFDDYIAEINATVNANPTILTPLEFRQLFTLAERGGIERAAETDDEVLAVVGDFRAASEMDLASPITAGALGLLVSKGLLTQDRMNQILAGEGPE